MLRSFSRLTRYYDDATARKPGNEPYARRIGGADVSVDTRTVVDPSRGVEMVCRMAIPRGMPGRWPVVVYSVPTDWYPDRPSAWGVYISDALAAAGYLAVSVRHVGGDAFIVKPETPSVGRRTYVSRRLHDLDSHHNRYLDLGFLLDTLERWDHDLPGLAGRIDLSRIGVSGHSLGAATAMMLAGLRHAPAFRSYKDRRVKATIAYSNMSFRPDTPRECFSQIDVPALYMTGTRDFSFTGRKLPEDKLRPFHGSAAASRYALILRGADHHTFGGLRDEEGRAGARERRCQQWTRSIALAFWDAYLRDDGDARRWLDEEAGRLLGRDGRLRRK